MQTLTGKQYLMAEIACKHDKAYEKATWDERIAHFHEMDFFNPKTFKKASNPIGLRAAVLAYDDASAGNPTGYMISLDACSSGLQILSLLVSCSKSFSLCGGDSQRCVDSYVEIYDSMNLHGQLTRKQVKQAIMTSLYGSVAMPELTFGDNVDLFYETMESMAPGAWNLNLGLQELWEDVDGSTYDWVLPDNFHAAIETKVKTMVPFTFFGSTFELPVKVDGRPDFHKGLGPNLIHSIDALVVREMFRRCMFNKESVTRLMNIITQRLAWKHPSKKAPLHVATLWDHYLKSGFLSTRIFDYLDSDTITMVDDMVIARHLASLPDEPFQLVSVHDCFRCHPNYGNELRLQYNKIMCDLKNSEMLKFIASQVTNNPNLKTRKVGKIADEVILDGNYLLA